MVHQRQVRADLIAARCFSRPASNAFVALCQSDKRSHGRNCARSHGGGYSYRLCPKSEPLTEACFQKMPLEFVNGSGALRWDGPHGTTENIAWPYLKTGTYPPGSSWARNPIPRQNMFPPPCKESPGCKGDNGLRTECRCSGMWGPYNLEIVDRVKVPKVPAGEYVVGWCVYFMLSARFWQRVQLDLKT